MKKKTHRDTRTRLNLLIKRINLPGQLAHFIWLIRFIIIYSLRILPALGVVISSVCWNGLVLRMIPMNIMSIIIMMMAIPGSIRNTTLAVVGKWILIRSWAFYYISLLNVI